MRPVTDLDEVKAIELSILERVDDFCAETGIEYYLAYGTLIGAIRHGGFIPWDDDIDLWMKRAEYERFVAECPSWAQGHGLFLNCGLTTPGYNRVFAKVCDARTELRETDYVNPYREGAFLDVFPVDGLPKGRLARWLHLTALQAYKLRLLCSASVKHGGRWSGPLGAAKKALASVAGLGVDESKVRGYRRAAMRCMPNGTGEVCFPATGRMGRNNVGVAAAFGGAVPVEFEGLSLPAPVGYDELLTTIYGDYMELPPEPQRVPHHGFVLYADYAEGEVAPR